MMKNEFIQRAEKTAYSELVAKHSRTSFQHNLVLKDVAVSDSCYLVASGRVYQLWIARGGDLMPVSTRKGSAFCEVEEIVHF